jgi:hypothetical protein
MISLHTILTRLFVVTFHFALAARPASSACDRVSARECDAGAEGGIFSAWEIRRLELTIANFAMRVDYAVGLLRSQT